MPSKLPKVEGSIYSTARSFFPLVDVVLSEDSGPFGHLNCSVTYAAQEPNFLSLLFIVHIHIFGSTHEALNSHSHSCSSQFSSQAYSHKLTDCYTKVIPLLEFQSVKRHVAYPKARRHIMFMLDAWPVLMCIALSVSVLQLIFATCKAIVWKIWYLRYVLCSYIRVSKVVEDRNDLLT